MINNNSLLFLFLGSAAIVVSCTNEKIKSEGRKNLLTVSNEKVDSTFSRDTLEIEREIYAFKEKDSAFVQRLQNIGLVDIQTINTTILVDLKYATTDNFMKIRLYDTLVRAFLQKDVAIRLGKCQEFLERIRPGFHLLVYDAVRPISVQYKMWKALDTIPVKERSKFVSNPVNGSIHNYGAAVDLTICDQNGIPLDIGADYDDIRLIAYPSKEQYFLKTGELSISQIENRQLLRKVMASEKFTNISTEWWHFNACSRNAAKAKYKALK